MIRFLVFFLFGALAAGGSWFFHTRETHDSAWWTDECERVDLQSRLDIYKMRLASRNTGSLAPDIDEARAGNAVLEKRIADLKERTRELESSIEKTESGWAAMHEQRIRESRESALGREWPEFVVATGKTYHEAKVVGVDDFGVTLRHRHGAVTVRYADLSEDQRILFGLDEESAVAAEEAERKQHRAYHFWLDEEIKEAEFNEAMVKAQTALFHKEAKALRSQANRSKQVPKVWQPVASVPTVKPTLEIGSLSAPARRFGYRRSLYSRPGNTIYYYPYNHGGGCYSPGYSNGTYRTWTFARSPVIARPPTITPVVPSAPTPTTP